MPKLTQGPRVLMVLHDIQDLGGIINWVEHLCHGFKTLNAEPILVRLENKDRCVASRCSRTQTIGHSGLHFDQRGGWHFPVENRIPIRTVDWDRYTAKYDLVIWVVPVPSKTKLFSGWKDLYQIHTPQVMVIHDGNLNKLYSYAYEVMDECVAIACVHDCAYGNVNRPHKHLIPNAQIARTVKEGKRSNQVFSLQTFKRWKRVDDLVRAVPYIKGQVQLAGGGIEYYYMTSKDKCKPEYAGIWEKAEKSGMQYLGYIDERERDDILSRSKLLIDPSWSKSYAKYGSHFNRTFVDAIIAGCLPAGRDLLMDGNSFFDPSDYITIPWNASPEEFGETVNQVLSMSSKEYSKRVRNLRRVVYHNFDSVHIARRYLEFCQ